MKRSKRNAVEVSNRSFSGDLDGFYEWQKGQVQKKLKHLNQDQFSEQGETEVRCINGKDKIIINPIIDWQEKDVWDFLDNVAKVEHCKLYDEGWHRIGCICCPMSNNKHKVMELQRYPHVKKRWLWAIKEIRKGNYDNMLLNNDWGNGTEDERCEQIFNWWISGKAYDKWYADTFLQKDLFE